MLLEEIKSNYARRSDWNSLFIARKYKGEWFILEPISFTMLSKQNKSLALSSSKWEPCDKEGDFI